MDTESCNHGSISLESGSRSMFARTFRATPASILTPRRLQTFIRIFGEGIYTGKRSV
jgi:hypothetical protein